MNKLLCMVLAVAAMAASARELVVAPEGTGTEFSNEHPGAIAEAFEIFKDGDQIILQDGVYRFAPEMYHDASPIMQKEHIGTSALTRGWKTFVRSASGDPSKCIFDGEHRGLGRAMTLSRWSLVEGITFRNFDSPKSDGGALLFVWDGTVTNCVFENCSALNGGALCRGSAYDSRFVSNRAELCGGAAFYVNGIYDSTFVSNRTMSGTAGAVGQTVYTRGRLMNCQFIDNASPMDLNQLTISKVVGGFAITNCTIRSESACVYGRRDGGPYVNSVRVKPGDDLKAARDFLRANRDPKGRAEIVFADGVYPLAETGFVRFDRRDDYLTLRAEHPGKAELSGSLDFTLGDFKPITDPAERARFKPQHADKIVALEVSEAVAAYFKPELLRQAVLSDGTGFQHFQFSPPYRAWGDRGDEKPTAADPVNYPRFVADDRPEQFSRWPNEGEYNIVLGKDAIVQKHLVKVDGKNVNTNSIAKLWFERMHSWHWDDEDVGYWYKPDGWSFDCARVIAHDPEAGSLTSAVGQRLEHGGGYFFNVVEEIDRPGEWAFDHRTRKLYYYPREGMTAKSRCSIAISADSQFTLRDTTGVVIEGLRFARRFRRPTLILNETISTRIVGCDFVAVGDLAITGSGWSNVVRSCNFRNLAGGAIFFTGGDIKTIRRAGNVVDNCLFENSGMLHRSCGVVGFSGCGNTLRHSVIRHAPHVAIGANGYLNLWEYNRIYDVCSYNRDCGLVHNGTSLTTLGGVMRYNDFGTSTENSVYLDDCTSGYTIYGNVIRDAGCGFFLGGGRYLTISNNLIYACHSGFHLDNRGLWWPSFRNSADEIKYMIEQLNCTGETWLATFPYTRNIPLAGTNLHAHTDNAFVNNLLVNVHNPTDLAEFHGLLGPEGGLKSSGNWKVWLEAKNNPSNIWRIGGFDLAHGPIGEPLDLGFVDLPPKAYSPERPYCWRKGDFTLKPGSWVERNMPDFSPIPWKEIGLYRDQWRQHPETDELDEDPVLMRDINAPRLRYVAPDGKGDVFAIDEPGRLEDAVERFNDGRTIIILKDGVYRFPESSYRPTKGRLDREFGPSIVAGGYYIRSESGDPAKCVLDGENKGCGRAMVLCRYSRLEGVGFRNFGKLEDLEGGALFCYWEATVSNCVFESCSATKGGAVDRALLYDCVFRDNRAKLEGGAICGGWVVRGCRFERNEVTTSEKGKSEDATISASYPNSVPSVSDSVFDRPRERAIGSWCKFDEESCVFAPPDAAK